jgi:hypothetical protein
MLGLVLVFRCLADACARRNVPRLGIGAGHLVPVLLLTQRSDTPYLETVVRRRCGRRRTTYSSTPPSPAILDARLGCE